MYTHIEGQKKIRGKTEKSNKENDICGKLFSARYHGYELLSDLCKSLHQLLQKSHLFFIIFAPGGGERQTIFGFLRARRRAPL